MLSSSTQLSKQQCRCWWLSFLSRTFWVRLVRITARDFVHKKRPFPPDFFLFFFFFFFFSISHDAKYVFSSSLMLTHCLSSRQGRHCSAHCSLSPILRQVADVAALCDGHQHPQSQSSRRGHVNAHPVQAPNPSQSCEQDHPSLASAHPAKVSYCQPRRPHQ